MQERKAQRERVFWQSGRVARIAEGPLVLPGKGSDTYAGAGRFFPEYSRFRPSPQRFLVPIGNERLVTPENGMVASALDSAFPGADIEHVFGHFLQDIGPAVVFIHHFSLALDRSKEGNEVDGQNFLPGCHRVSRMQKRVEHELTASNPQLISRCAGVRRDERQPALCLRQALCW